MYTFGYLASKELAPEQKDSAMRLMEAYIQTPDPGSIFEKVVSQMGALNPSQKIQTLMGQGFDALLNFDGNAVAGFLAIRRDVQSKTVHVFRVQTEEAYRGNGVAVANLAKLAEDALQNGPYAKIQAGMGRSEALTRCLEALKRQHAEQIGIDVRPETGEIIKKVSLEEDLARG